MRRFVFRNERNSSDSETWNFRGRTQKTSRKLRGYESRYTCVAVRALHISLNNFFFPHIYTLNQTYTIFLCFDTSRCVFFSVFLSKKSHSTCSPETLDRPMGCLTATASANKKTYSTMAHSQWPMTHDPWLIVHGPWRMVHGSWRMVHGVWPMTYGPWRMAHGVWPMAYGPWRMAHGAWSMVHGPTIKWKNRVEKREKANGSWKRPKGKRNNNSECYKKNSTVAGPGRWCLRTLYVPTPCSAWPAHTWNRKKRRWGTEKWWEHVRG